MYKKVFKRLIDLILSVLLLILFCPIFIILIIVGVIVMKGNPFFLQQRPGKKGKTGKEKIFYLIKLRTMSNTYGLDGELLPDEQRVSKYGKWLRSTSLDELPELLNIIKGDMSIVGPRPQLVRDMVFMSEEQRKRHDVRPGLTGLAQINGRNNINWEKKFEYDLQYINNGITFMGDLKILFMTIGKVLKREDIVREGTISDIDFGDWLLEEKKIDKMDYEKKQADAKKMLKV